MFNLTQTESLRASRQAAIDASKSLIERNKLGQFSTPIKFATEIVQEALSYARGIEKIRFLDPALGTGAFFSALLAITPPHLLSKAVGVEIDPSFSEAAKQIWQETILEVIVTDFTTLGPPEKPENKFSLVVCNPPYVRHHHINSSDKLRLRKIAIERTGIKLSGLAGLYCYFMLTAHDWMVPGAIGAWLVPSEFLDVNYGEGIKEYLLKNVSLGRIHRFDASDLQFDDALVASTVVWFKNELPTAKHTVRFSWGEDLLSPSGERVVSHSELHSNTRWSQITKPNFVTTHQAHDIQLQDLFSIKRGIATGANDYFILNQDRVNELQLPREVLRPVLPSPRHLKSEIVLANVLGDPIVEKPLWLIDCSLPILEIKERYPTLYCYLQIGTEHGINTRYLCRARNPWYAQEKRDKTNFVCSYMGRGSKTNSKPFRFIVNMSNAIAANAYMMLYPKLSLYSYIDGNEERTYIVWNALKNLPIDDVINQSRVYGDGLHKLEPSEMGRVSAQSILKEIPELRMAF